MIGPRRLSAVKRAADLARISPLNDKEEAHGSLVRVTVIYVNSYSLEVVSFLQAKHFDWTPRMATPLAVGLGVAVAAFLVCSHPQKSVRLNSLTCYLQGRAGLVAMRKYRGGVAGAGALGKAFYKGGFEPRMNRREAALILQLRYMQFSRSRPSISS